MRGDSENALDGRSEQEVPISPFPPIGDYAFLSDCETTALIAPSGNVEWLCLPRMDSPSVFGSILDRDAGGFRVGPADVRVPAARRYIPGTMVLETTWETRMGWVIVRDALSIGPWRHETERSQQPPALADRPRRRPRDAADDQVRAGLGGDQARLRAGLRLRRPGRRLVLHRLRVQRGGGALGGHGPRAAARHRSAPRLRGPAGAGADDAARGRGLVRRARLVEESAALDLRGGSGPDGGDAVASGRSGSSTARSRITRGAPTCSAAL